MNGTELRCFNDLQTLTKITYPDLRRYLQLTNFEVCLLSLQGCESQSKLSNSNVKMIYKCCLDEWKRIKKF